MTHTTPAPKPPYRVPTMEEIRALPWNGFTATSTFSGCGGSSLGYRMAGFRMAWASEFIPAAQDTYRANAAPYTVLDTRDIREVAAAELLEAAGLGVGEIDLFDGSPPCASFSTNGKREAGWGQVKPYSDTKQRTDDLFFEYARLIEDARPRTFVAENVAGLVRGTAKGYFKEILARLKACGYRVAVRHVDAAWLGVPQTRNRLIFLGVRDDLPAEPAQIKPLRYQYGLAEACATLGTPAGLTEDPETGEPLSILGYAVGNEWLKLKPGEQSKKFFGVSRDLPDRPGPCILAGAGGASHTGVCHWEEPRKYTLAELRRIGGFPDDFVLTGTYLQRWERIGRAVPPVMMSHVAAAVRDQVLIPLRDRGVI